MTTDETATDILDPDTDDDEINNNNNNNNNQPRITTLEGQTSEVGSLKRSQVGEVGEGDNQTSEQTSVQTSEEMSLDREYLEMVQLKGSQQITLKAERWLVRGFERWLNENYPGLNIQDGLRGFMWKCFRGRYDVQLEAIPVLSARVKAHVKPGRLAVCKPFEGMTERQLEDWIANHAAGMDGYAEACEEYATRRKAAPCT